MCWYGFLVTSGKYIITCGLLMMPFTLKTIGRLGSVATTQSASDVKTCSFICNFTSHILTKGLILLHS
uniref:Uncharacterized protein n=1 Tax=Lepeophtheirus salmonis TaxID=72036 RepID=A0A0K2TP68_LEPSM